MAETPKKAKAPGKPKAEAKPKTAARTEAKPKTAAKATARSKPATGSSVSEQLKAVTPSHAEIAQLAQRYWTERGHQDGHAEQDWLRAERELMKAS